MLQHNNNCKHKQRSSDVLAEKTLNSNVGDTKLFQCCIGPPCRPVLVIKNNRISGTYHSLALKSFLSEGPPPQHRIYFLLPTSQTLTFISPYHIMLLSHVYLFITLLITYINIYIIYIFYILVPCTLK